MDDAQTISKVSPFTMAMIVYPDHDAMEVYLKDFHALYPYKLHQRTLIGSHIIKDKYVH